LKTIATVNYYNDNDPKACAWLRELIAAGELPAGDVDCRSILEVKADELAGYSQCHFFAGIGGWPLALRWAGLEGVAGIWTGSCPCQPLSCAGKRKGHADERHLWPAFHDLIAQCRPARVFGEQVASKDGREWLAGVRLDLEDLGYACGGADLCAAGVGAPHRRQRLFWVAESICGRRDTRCREGSAGEKPKSGNGIVEQRGSAGGVGDASRDHQRRTRESGPGDGWEGEARRSGAWSHFDILRCRDIDKKTGRHKARRVEAGTFPLAHGIPGRLGLLRGYGNAIVPQVAAEFVMAWRECSTAPAWYRERIRRAVEGR
jgi:DNA (cytosine-5)-methyltransferase 1